MRLRVPPKCQLLLGLWLTACQPEPPGEPDTSRLGAEKNPPSQASSSAVVDLLEPRVSRAVAGDAQWKYVQRATADFDGDGRDETAVLIADVTLNARGIPLWEHGHRWQVYIEEADSTRTYVYARFLPNGKLEASVTVPDNQKLPTIVLRELTPHALGVYEVRYAGPQRATSVRHLQRELDPGRGFIGARQGTMRP